MNELLNLKTRYDKNGTPLYYGDYVLIGDDGVGIFHVGTMASRATDDLDVEGGLSTCMFHDGFMYVTAEDLELLPQDQKKRSDRIMMLKFEGCTIYE
jgi:hypothetical protein